MEIKPMSKKSNITGETLKGINEVEIELEPKLKEEKIEIDEWINTWSKERNTSIIVIHANKEGKEIVPLIIQERAKLDDFTNYNKEDKKRFLKEILRGLQKVIG